MSEGYVRLYRPGHVLASKFGWVPEHRMVAYEAGLLIDLSMHVHHKDGNNLEVLSASDHHREHSDGGGPAFQRSKTHCPKGHPYDEANTRFYLGTKRACRACDNERHWRERQAAKAAKRSDD